MKSFYTFQNLSKEKSCHHLVTQKDKSKMYAFSLALHTQEKPQYILKNRAKLRKKFPNVKFIVANQTHSANSHIITKAEELGWNSLDNAIKDIPTSFSPSRESSLFSKRKVLLSL